MITQKNIPSDGFTLQGQVIDVVAGKITPALIRVENGRIAAIEPTLARGGPYILPGFIDAHVHIESSLLTPVGFARLAVVHGTVATVSDPHEIGNVLGTDGVRYMIENGGRYLSKFYFGAPSCVPATSLRPQEPKLTRLRWISCCRCRK